MNLFQSLWEKLLDKYRNYASAQKERIQHLQELELENEQHKGHIQNPLSLVSRNREISRLKREIKDYRNKCLSVCGVVALLFFLLLCFSISAIGARRDERNHIRELMVSSMATSSSSFIPTPIPEVTPSASYNNSITHAVPLYLAFSNTDPYTHSNNRANHFSASFCRSIFGYSSPR